MKIENKKDSNNIIVIFVDYYNKKESYMEIYQILKEIGAEYKEITHCAVFTVEQAKFIEKKLDGIGCKNLFVTDNKGRYFLILVFADKKVNLKHMAEVLGTSRLSFADEKELSEILGTKFGSVSPLGIINDKNQKVVIVIDEQLQGKKILVHPNDNTKTLAVEFKDLLKFIEHENHKAFVLPME